MIMQKLRDTGLSFRIGAGVLLLAIPMVASFAGYIIPEVERHYSHDNSRTAVQSAFNLLNAFEEEVATGKATLQEAQARAAKVIGSLRYSEREYFWIHDLNLKMVHHPTKPELNGTSLAETKDSDGRNFFVEMNQIATSKGEGWVSYHWPKPGSDKPLPKVSYVKLFKPWGWVLGSGTYIEDSVKKVSEFEHSLYATVFACIGLLVLAGMTLAYFISTRIHSVSTNVVSGTDRVREKASRMDAIATDLRRACDNQGESIQTTAAAVDEISVMLKTTSDSAKQLDQVAQESKQAASNGQDATRAAVEAMAGIQASNDRITQQIQQNSKNLNSISALIGEMATKTKVINDIVFQTKLLSFNASVEAARAGEHGKGFAVVAEEVGKLAQISGQAAREIDQMIEGSTQRVSQIITEMEAQFEAVVNESRQKIEVGGNAVARCGDALAQIVREAENVTRMTSNINNAIEEQSKGIADIGRSIEQMERATSGNRSSAASAAEQSLDLIKESIQVKEEVLTLVQMNGGTNSVNLIEWDDVYSVRIGAVDDQHKQLVDLINALHRAIVGKRGREEQQSILDGLINYVKTHFGEEEEMMKAAQYPAFDAHKKMHDAFVGKIESAYSDFRSGRALSPEMTSFLKDWLVGHIVGKDKDYVPYVDRARVGLGGLHAVPGHSSRKIA